MKSNKERKNKIEERKKARKLELWILDIEYYVTRWFLFACLLGMGASFVLRSGDVTR
jgi:hypothetical protein